MNECFRNCVSIKYFIKLKLEMSIIVEAHTLPIVQKVYPEDKPKKYATVQDGNHDIDHTGNFTNDVTYKGSKFKFNFNLP